MSTATKTASTALIAILRGLTNAQAARFGQCVYDAGFRSLEVPLNSPDPLLTIRTLRASLPADCIVGAGTVITVDQVRRCHEAGAQIIVSPNTDTAVIAETLRLGMGSFPGAATPSEAFTAIHAGAGSVKIFPAEQVGTAGLKAWTTVIPKEIGLIPVGGLDASNLKGWLNAGATGFGIGSAVFKPGISVDELHRRAVCIVEAMEIALASSGIAA